LNKKGRKKVCRTSTLLVHVSSEILSYQFGSIASRVILIFPDSLSTVHDDLFTNHAHSSRAPAYQQLDRPCRVSPSTHTGRHWGQGWSGWSHPSPPHPLPPPPVLIRPAVSEEQTRLSQAVAFDLSNRFCLGLLVHGKGGILSSELGVPSLELANPFVLNCWTPWSRVHSAERKSWNISDEVRQARKHWES